MQVFCEIFEKFLLTGMKTSEVKNFSLASLLSFYFYLVFLPAFPKMFPRLFLKIKPLAFPKFCQSKVFLFWKVLKRSRLK
jgi:hypothetical protein